MIKIITARPIVVDIKKKYKFNTLYFLDVLAYSWDIQRSHADFRLTFVNKISRVMLNFLILFTFDVSKYNLNFEDLILVTLQNFEDVLGSYTYNKICKNLKITNIVKQFPYFKRNMKKEKFCTKNFLFSITKSLIYRIFVDKLNTLYFKTIKTTYGRYLHLKIKLLWV